MFVTCDNLVCFTSNATGHRASDCAVMAQVEDVRSYIVTPINNLQRVEAALAEKSHSELVNDTSNIVLPRDDNTKK